MPSMLITNLIKPYKYSEIISALLLVPLYGLCCTVYLIYLRRNCITSYLTGLSRYLLSSFSAFSAYFVKFKYENMYILFKFFNLNGR